MYQYNYAPSGYAPYEIPDSAFRQQDLGIEWHVQEDGCTVTGTYRCTRGGGRWTATIIRRERIRLGRVWFEQEGGWSGVWRRRGNSNIFDARWTMPGAQDVTAVLTINIFGNNVQVLRRNSSDGNNCDYIGTIAGDGRTVTGTFSCTQGGGTWRAIITF
ncbi:hypothetical protein [Paenibacillus macerans]|uniref:hypothetical protein n=1 Tax=Paenibacillus macerans TaxID=44252 RepID=UPI001BCE1516|nr:hypothetical protein [Paenibacillus macerans]